MRGAALAFEPMVRELAAPPDVVVTTDMLNLPEFVGVMSDGLPPGVPVITYFHENQITYPLPRQDERDFHFGLANIYTALASRKVVFNSWFHQEEFLAAIPGVLGLMPDYRPDDVPERIRRRSAVLGVPLEIPETAPSSGDRPPIILWNHRWEEDKDPETFFRVMTRLDEMGIDFRIMMLGESFRERPDCFARAERSLAHRIEHWGYLPSREAYLAAVSRCRVVVSTARHEFFGLAVREAIALGCFPLLPRRVVYPELVGGRNEHLYNSEDELTQMLVDALNGPGPSVDPELVDSTAALKPQAIVDCWDAWIEDLT